MELKIAFIQKYQSADRIFPGYHIEIWLPGAESISAHLEFCSEDDEHANEQGYITDENKFQIKASAIEELISQTVRSEENKKDLGLPGFPNLNFTTTTYYFAEPNE